MCGSRWPCSLRRRSEAARVLGSLFGTPLRGYGLWSLANITCCVGSGPCGGMITR